MLFNKVTHKTDDELNDFFRRHQDIRIVKFIIASGQYHMIYTKDTRFEGLDHLNNHRERFVIQSRTGGGRDGPAKKA